MRTALLFISCLLFQVLAAQNVVKIQPSAIVKFENSVLVCFNDMNLENDAPLNMAHGDALVYFTGTADNSITGSGAVFIDRLAISKSVGSRLLLNKNITIQQAVAFISGLIDLNGQTMQLAPVAILSTETDASRITGNSGFVEISQLLNAPNSANPGNLGLRITSASNLGNTVVRRGHASQTNGGGMGSSILRYFDIQPANNTNLDATLRMDYLHSELNGMAENSLHFWKSSDLSNWSFEGFSIRSTSFNYVEKSGIQSFSRWTLSTINNPLPLDFLSFHVLCGIAQGAVNMKWTTANEVNVASFLVQGSVNGSQWKTLGSVKAVGNGQAVETYTYQHQSADAYQYFRVAAVDVDGKIQYTDVIRQQCAGADNLRVWPNPFRDQLTVTLSHSRSSVAAVEVFNAKGQLVKNFQRTLVPGMNSLQLDLAELSAGLYTIRLKDGQGLLKSVQVIK